MHYEFSQADSSDHIIEQPKILYKVINGIHSYKFDLKNHSNLSTFYNLVKLKIIPLWQGQIIQIMKNLFDSINDLKHGYLSNPNSIWICKHDLRIIIIHYNEKSDYEDDFTQVKFLLQNWCSLLNQATYTEFTNIRQTPRKAEIRKFLEKLVGQLDGAGYHPDDKRSLINKKTDIEKDYESIQEQLKKSLHQTEQLHFDFAFRLWDPLDLISEIKWNYFHGEFLNEIQDKSYKKLPIKDMINNANTNADFLIKQIIGIPYLFEQKIKEAIQKYNYASEQLFRGSFLLADKSEEAFIKKNWNIFEIEITLRMNDKRIFENPCILHQIDIEGDIFQPLFKDLLKNHITKQFKEMILSYYVENFEPTLDVSPKQKQNSIQE